MSKLPKAYQFTDISDYGRPLGRFIAQELKNTRFNAVHVTFGFVIAAMISLGMLWQGHLKTAAAFLILKSIIDAADGELARLQNKPSYVGRYLDSVSDILINLALILSVGFISQISIWLSLAAFASLQLQGTLYNYYYVILRNSHEGDTTSRVFEQKVPIALGNESQKWVTRLYYSYKFCYGLFDKIIYKLDFNASKQSHFPNWFMTALSAFGLGFQLLVMALLIAADKIAVIIPLILFANAGLIGFIGMRKWLFSS